MLAASARNVFFVRFLVAFAVVVVIVAVAVTVSRFSVVLGIRVDQTVALGSKQTHDVSCVIRVTINGAGGHLEYQNILSNATAAA